MKILLPSLAAALLLTAAPPSHADVTTRLDQDTNQVLTLRTGLDSAVAFTAGYARRIQPAFAGRSLLLFGELTLPAGSFDLGDSGLEAGVRTTAFERGNLSLQVQLGPSLRNTSSNLFAANALGIHGALLPGYRTRRWALMAELYYEKVLATHLRHSDLYRDIYYSDAESGWYRTTAGTVRLGVRGGARIRSVQLTLRLGVQRSEGGEAALPPFYGTLGAGYAF
jgi:hypothetical protein